MELIKTILILIISIIIGSGLWYLIFWFISSEPNLFIWHWGVKTIYLILAMSASGGTFEGIVKNS